MKKSILLIFAAVMTVFALSSCDAVGDLLGETGGSTGESIRYTITEDEWEDMKVTPNYTLSAVGTSNMNYNGESMVISLNHIIKSTKWSHYQKSTTGTSTTNHYEESTYEEYYTTKGA